MKVGDKVYSMLNASNPIVGQTIQHEKETYIANMLIQFSNVTLIHRRNEFRAQEENLEKFIKSNGKIHFKTN